METVFMVIRLYIILGVVIATASTTIGLRRGFQYGSGLGYAFINFVVVLCIWPLALYGLIRGVRS